MNSTNVASSGITSQKHVEKFQTLLLLDFMHGFLQKNIKDPATTLDYYSDNACAGSLLGDKYFKKPFNNKDDLKKLLTTNDKVKNSYSKMRYCINNVERRASDNLIILQVQGVLFQADQPQLGSKDFIRLLHFKHVKDDFFEITYDSISIIEGFKTTSLPSKDTSEDASVVAEREKLTNETNKIETDLSEKNEKLVTLEEKLIAKKKQIEEKKKQLKELKKQVSSFDIKEPTEAIINKDLSDAADAGSVKKAQAPLKAPTSKPISVLTDRTAEFSSPAVTGDNSSNTNNKPKQAAVLIDKTGHFKTSPGTVSQSPQPVNSKNKRAGSKDQTQKYSNKVNTSNNNSNSDLSQFATPSSTPPPTHNGDKKDELSKQQENDKYKKEQQPQQVVVAEEDDEWETVGKTNNKENNRNKKNHQRNDSDSNGYKKKKNNGGDINKHKSGTNKKNY